jgi:hypothetical protein
VDGGVGDLSADPQRRVGARDPERPGEVAEVGGIGELGQPLERLLEGVQALSNLRGSLRRPGLRGPRRGRGRWRGRRLDALARLDQRLDLLEAALEVVEGRLLPGDQGLLILDERESGCR